MTIAYLDPGAGSMIASAVVGGFAATAVAVKQYRRRLTSRFSRKRDESEATPGAEAEGVVDAPADAAVTAGDSGDPDSG